MVSHRPGYSVPATGSNAGAKIPLLAPSGRGSRAPVKNWPVFPFRFLSPRCGTGFWARTSFLPASS